MQIVFLGLVFLVIIGLLALKRPLYQSILGGLLAAAALYRIPPLDFLRQGAAVFTHWSSLSVIVSLYLITYLQQMLEARRQIQLAQQDLNGLFHNRLVNATVAPLFIGLLPSAGAMILCGGMVKDATDGYLKPADQAFVASWYRHIPESTLPTYTGVLLMSSLSGVALSEFVPGMLIPIGVLALLGYWPTLRRLPRDPGTPVSQNRRGDALRLLKHLWTLVAILALILILNLPVVPAVALVVAAAAIVYRFSPRDLGKMVFRAFEVNLMLNTFLMLTLKEVVAYTGVLEQLPAVLSQLPIPTYVVFALVFFLGGVISGTNGVIAMGTPLAFAALPGGMPLMVLLMCMCHAASQVSPTHLCLAISAEYFHVSLGELIRKTLPRALLFCGLMLGYYQLLMLL